MRKQLGLHDLAGLRVERGERLVHQQDFRIDGERAGEIDALAHAAGELARVIVLEAFEPDELEQLHGALAVGSADRAGDFAADDGVGEHRAPRQQAVVLEHKAAVGAGLAHGAAVEQHFAGRRVFEAGDDAQERGLAAAARPDHGNEFAALDVEIDAAQRFEVAERFATSA